MRESGGMRMFLLAAVVTGVFFRLYGLGVHSLWLDEGFTVHIASSESIPEALRQGTNPPLPFYLYRLVLQVSDPADWHLRLVPALLSCCSLLLFLRIAAICIEEVRARGAAVLLYAVSPFIIWYAHEVRTYAFLELTGLLALLSALLLPDRPRVACVLGFLSASLGVGSHYLAVMPLLSSLAIAGCWSWYGKIGRRRALLYSACVLAGTLFWVWWFISYLPDQLGYGWAPVTNTELLDVISLPARLVLIDLRFLPVGLVYAGAFIMGIGTLCLIWDLTRRAKTRRLDWRSAVLAIALLTPLLGTVAVSLTVQPRFTPRYLITATAPMLLLMCRCTPRAISGAASFALAAVMVAICASSNFLLHSHNLKEGYREASEQILEHLEPGDTVAVCTGMPDGFSEAPVTFYLGGQAASVPVVNIDSLEAFRDWLDVHPHRVHLVVRWMSYSSPLIETLLSETRQIAQSEIVENIQWILVTGEK